MLGYKSVENLVDADEKKLLRKVSPIFISKVAATVLGVGVKSFIVWKFGAEGNGAFAIYMSFLTVLGLLATFGMGNAALKLSASLFKDERNILRQDHLTMLGLTFLTVCTILLPIMWVAAEPLAGVFLHDEELSVLFRITALTLIPFCFLEINVEMVRGIGWSNAYLFFKELGIGIIMFISMFFLMKHDADLMTPIIAHSIGVTISSVICLVVMLAALKRKVIKEPKNEESIQGHSLRYLLNLSLPMLLSKGLVLLMPGLTILILGLFTEPAVVGVFSMALVIATVVPTISYSMNVVVAPAIAYYYKKEQYDRLTSVVKDSVRLAFWCSLPIIFCMLLFSKSILGLFGEEFSSGWLILCVFVLSHWFDMSCGPVGYLLIMTGKERKFGVITFTSTAVSIGIMLIITPFWGGLGAVLAFLLFFVIWNLGSIQSIKKHLKFNPMYIPGFSLR